MTTAVLSYSSAQKKNYSRVSFIGFPSVNWKAVCFIGFFIMATLLIFYVWQVNNLIHGSYLISSYENQISKLSDENKNLEVSFAENSFLGSALEKIKALNFQETTSVRYIQIPENALAKAN